ncbi:MAG: hypothetical protein FDX21_03110 [Chlorobium sp.]|nr:MAG: hypothetical protein FDX21_03110 [Chlorobium sp.]
MGLKAHNCNQIKNLFENKRAVSFYPLIFPEALAGAIPASSNINYIPGEELTMRINSSSGVL